VSVTAISTVSRGHGEGAALRHRLEPVLDEVEHGLAEERPVDGHGRHRGVGADVEGDTLPGGQRAHELRHRAHHVVHRILLELGPREARKGQILLGERVERSHLIANGNH
jgi:hypothetical protein